MTLQLVPQQKPVTDKPVFSHSKISSWRSCQQAWHYHYDEQLSPKRLERPLHLGSWVHACLEAYYGPTRDWRTGHKSYLDQYNKMLPDERFRLDRGNSKKRSEDPDDYEPLPMQVERIVRSYIWYYEKNTLTKVNERTLGVEMPFWLDRGDYILHGIIDRIYIDLDLGEDFVIIEDHKVWTEIPDESQFHTMDPQLTIYLPGAEALGVQAQAVEYNYAVSSPPGLPKYNKDGSLKGYNKADGTVNTAWTNTDYPTLYRSLKAKGLDPADYLSVLAPLQRKSPYLQRHRLARNPSVTAKILAETDTTVHEIMAHERTVRSIGRGCTYCPYVNLCRAELYDLDTTYIRKSQFMTPAEKKRLEKLRGKV